MPYNWNNNTLFIDNLPIINSDNELDEILENYKNYNIDPYYIATSCKQDRKKKIDKLWSVFKDDCDKHFLLQYKQIWHFHHRTWEMYIGCLFLHNNLNISSDPKWPDFLVNNQFYVECVACDEWKGENKVPNIQWNFWLIDPELRKKQMLRITNVIKKKKDKYISYQTWRIDKNKPYILAINSAECWFFQNYADIPIIIQAVFGFEYFQFSEKGEQSILRRDKITKKVIDGEISEVDVNIFTNDAYKEISGIIFCDQYVINHSDIIWEDCIFVNNPFAINPLNIENYPFLKRRLIEKNDQWLQLIKLYD